MIEIDISDRGHLFPVRFVRRIAQRFQFGDEKRGPWIAGGIARDIYLNANTIRGDIDIFVTNPDDMDHLEEVLGNPFRTNTETKRLFYDDGQIIQVTHFVGVVDLEGLFRSFDFNVAKVETDGYRLRMHPRAKESLDQLRLDIEYDECAKLPSLYRVMKYLRYGFNPEPGLIDRIVEVIDEENDDY